MDLISKKTRGEFEDHLSQNTFREISRYFDNYQLVPQILTENQPSGQRRTLILQYYAGVDWTNKKQVRQVLNVFADILAELESSGKQVDSMWANESRKKFEKLSLSLQRDGYIFENNTLVSINQTETDKLPDFLVLENASDLLDKGHFQEYVDRIKTSVDQDTGLAIGSTKELVEATLKTILDKLAIEFDKNDDIPKLLKNVQKALELVPDEVDESKKGADLIKILLNNLGQVVVKIAELRNLYGTGHGKEYKRKGLSERHARLVVGAGITLSAFLLETFELKRPK
jgi:Abortive infection C-terminus